MRSERVTGSGVPESYKGSASFPALSAPSKKHREQGQSSLLPSELLRVQGEPSHLDETEWGHLPKIRRHHQLKCWPGSQGKAARGTADGGHLADAHCCVSFLHPFLAAPFSGTWCYRCIFLLPKPESQKWKLNILECRTRRGLLGYWVRSLAIVGTTSTNVFLKSTECPFKSNLVFRHHYSDHCFNDKVSFSNSQPKCIHFMPICHCAKLAFCLKSTFPSLLVLPLT